MADSERPAAPDRPERKRRRAWLALAAILIALILLLAWILVPRPPGGVHVLDFTLPEATSEPPGLPWTLSDHLGDKPILLEFMDPNIAFSQASAVVLRQLGAGPEGSRVCIVSIALGIMPPTPTLESTRSFAEAHGGSWTYVVDANATTLQPYNVTGVPLYVLLTRDGAIAWRHVGVTTCEALEAAIRDLD